MLILHALVVLECSDSGEPLPGSGTVAMRCFTPMCRPSPVLSNIRRPVNNPAKAPDV